MKKIYERPIILCENFMLNNSIAAGKCVDDPLPKEEYDPVDIYCFSSITDESVFYRTSGVDKCSTVPQEGANYKAAPSDMTFTSWETAKQEMYDYIVNDDKTFSDTTTGNGYKVSGGTYYFAWKSGHGIHVGPIDLSVLKTNSY